MAACFGFGGTGISGLTSSSISTPRQTFATQADVPVAGFPSSHSSPSPRGVFCGQTLLAPSQTASRRHAAAATRHTLPAAATRQVASQQVPGVPFAVPASHCSPSSSSTLPSPQTPRTVVLLVLVVEVVLVGLVDVLLVVDELVVVLMLDVVLVVVELVLVVVVAGVPHSTVTGSDPRGPPVASSLKTRSNDPFGAPEPRKVTSKQA